MFFSVTDVERLWSFEIEHGSIDDDQCISVHVVYVSLPWDMWRRPGQSILSSIPSAVDRMASHRSALDWDVLVLQDRLNEV